MSKRYRRILLSRVDDRVLRAALVFMCCAMFSALIKADIKTVEQLEFTRVVLLGDNEMELSQGETASLRIRGAQSKLTPVPFDIRGDTLRLGVTADNQRVSGIKFKLTTPILEALEVQGSGEAYVQPLRVGNLVIAVEGSGDIRMYDVSADDLELRVAGSGAVQAVNVTAREARLNLKGSGDIQLGSLTADSVRGYMHGSGDMSIESDGRVGDLEISVMGSGDVSMGKVRAATANVSIMGSGDVDVSVDEELEVEIMGSGDLHYRGNPHTSTSVLGSGEIRKRD